MAWTRYVRLLTGAGLVSVVLVAAAPDPSALRAGLADPERWVQRDGLDVVLAQVVGSVAWLVALWLAAGFVLVAGARLPGAAGRASAVLARGALPAGLRRTAAVALGASLATSALPALCASSAAAEGRGTPSAAASNQTWPAGVDRLPARSDLDPWSRRTAFAPPTDRPPQSEADDRPTPAAAPDAAGPTDASPTTEIVDWPTGEAAVRTESRAPAAGVDWPMSPTASDAVTRAQDEVRLVAGTADTVSSKAVEWPLGGDGGPRPVSVARSYVVARAAEPVIVAPGDTLWSIASRRLGPGAPAPAIAVEWRRWHAANRALVGPDPRRLRPGTALRPPATG